MLKECDKNFFGSNYQQLLLFFKVNKLLRPPPAPATAHVTVATLPAVPAGCGWSFA